MNQEDAKYIKLLDQDEYLIDPRDERRIPMLEADYDLVLNYHRMFWAEPPMTRVLYQRLVEDGETGDPQSLEEAVRAATDGAMRLTKLSKRFGTPEVYSAHWLVRKPLMKVLMARISQEVPTDAVD